MASYKVSPKPSVEKDLRSLPKSALARVLKSLEILANDPFPRQALKLEGGEQLYRLRVGDYGVVYSVNQKIRKSSFTTFAIGGKFIAFGNNRINLYR
jgi:mRNA interferase RelE/StbE